MNHSGLPSDPCRITHLYNAPPGSTTPTSVSMPPTSGRQNASTKTFYPGGYTESSTI
jgi:hypothetical protein